MAGKSLDEDELVHPRDVEEGRRLRRVDHLIPSEGEVAQEAVEVALRLWAEIKLRLLDQEQETAEPLRVTGLDGLQKSQRSC